MGSSPLHRFSRAVALLLLACATACPAGAEDLFRDKTVRLIVGSPPGGGYDTFGRLVARHLSAHLPGKPVLVVANMPGASGTTSVNYLYNQAPKDGSAIALFDSAMPFYEAVGQLGIRFKSAELSWIGSLTRTVNVIAVSAATGVQDLKQARGREIVLGSTTSGGIMSIYPAIANALLGTHFKIVTGYEGSNAVDLALERGEVEARGILLSSWKVNRPDWLREHKVVPLVQVGLTKDPLIPDVPLLTDLATSDEERAMFRFVSAPQYFERPFAGPPGMSRDALAAFRAGFAEMVGDPAFVEESRKQDILIDPLPGERLEQIVADTVATPRAIVERVKALAGLNQ